MVAGACIFILDIYEGTQGDTQGDAQCVFFIVNEHLERPQMPLCSLPLFCVSCLAPDKPLKLPSDNLLIKKMMWDKRPMEIKKGHSPRTAHIY